MERQPRYTMFFQKRATLRQHEMTEALSDPAIRDAWEHTVAALRAVKASGPGQSVPPDALFVYLAQERGVFYDAFTQLLALVCARAPQIALVWGQRLPIHLFRGVCSVLGLAMPTELERAAALSPGNPIRRLAPNFYYISEDISEFLDPEHRRKCLLELDGYL